MAEVIGVSEAQLRFVTNSSSGMGLIKYGSAVILLDNRLVRITIQDFIGFITLISMR